MQQLKSGMVGVVCGWKCSWGAKNDLSALLSVIGHRLANEADGAPRRREGRHVDHQERSQASLGHGPAAVLREGALGARIRPLSAFICSRFRRRPRWAIWTSSCATKT